MPNTSLHTTGKKYCVCCQQLVSISTAYRHRRLQAPPRLKAISPFLRDGTSAPPWQPSDGNKTENHEVPAQADAEFIQEPCDPELTLGRESIDDESASQTAIIQDAMSKLSREWTRGISPDEGEDDCDETNAHSNKSYESSQGSTGLDLQDQLGERFERDLVAIGELCIACMCSLTHELHYSK